MVSDFRNWFNYTDIRITRWMSRYGILFLRISLGIVFLWFGALKFFPGLSPAEELALQTIERLTFGFIAGDIARWILAAWESLIGLFLLRGIWMRLTLLLLFAQMIGTILPVFFFPHQVFVRIPLVPTLEGQYIIKNLVIISAGIVIGATVRGGNLVAEPEVVELAEEHANTA
jgi:uncharacterized membrane protein YphA (DoxX/SURF4 family)